MSIHGLLLFLLCNDQVPELAHAVSATIRANISIISQAPTTETAMDGSSATLALFPSYSRFDASRRQHQ
jgi:hypothetical protein